METGSVTLLEVNGNYPVSLLFYDGVKFYVSSQEHFYFVVMYLSAWFLKQALLHIKGGKHLLPWEALKNTKTRKGRNFSPL